MDIQPIIDIGLSALIACIGWFARVLWEAVEALKEDLHEMRVDLSKSYVRREDYREDMGEIKVMLKQIYDKLDTKVSKEDLK